MCAASIISYARSMKYACIYCKIEDLPITAFYPSVPYRCKECSKKYEREKRAKNPEKARARGRAFYNSHRDHIRDYERRRYKEKGPKGTQSGKLAIVKRWAAANPEKRKAAQRLWYAVKTGKIIRPTKCSKCGYEGRIDGHHHDYSKPYDVTWLCASCHRIIHNEERRSATSSQARVLSTPH